MSALLRAETVKLTTTRGTIWLMLGAAGVAALGAFATISAQQAANLDGPLHSQQFFLLAAINVSLFALISGMRIFTEEFRHGSIVPTFLVAPNRGRVLLAKAIVGAGLGAVIGIAAQAVMFAIAIPLLAAKGVPLVITTDDVLAAAGLTAACAVWAVIGVGVGAIVRHQVAAIVGGVIWILVIENIGAGFLGRAGEFLPGRAGLGVSLASAAGDLLPAFAAAAVLAGYVAVIALIAAITLGRRDVTTA